jgi:tRNA(Ile)-lysidine synthase
MVLSESSLGPGSAPISAAAFAELMAPLGPFGPSPGLAVAVSGGADSLALAVLLQDWAADCDGSVTALTVDHGLRRESAAEARQVAATLRPLGLAHHCLKWRGAHGLKWRGAHGFLKWRGAHGGARGGLQMAAREARYALLQDWCARQGVLFLVLGHHREDQAETLLLRLGRGSGLDGLAAMAAVSETPRLRLLRPLLTLPKASLEATLAARGIPWIEDPSNRDPAHARVRMRRLMPALAREGLSAARLADTARHLGRARAALDGEVARLLAAAVALHPAGYARLDVARLAAAPDEVALRALARLLTTIGGAAYPPRLERLERLHARLRAGARSGTLGGCRIAGAGGGGGRDAALIIARELAPVEAAALRPGRSLQWDGRFEIALGRGAAKRAPWRVAALGSTGPGPGRGLLADGVQPAVLAALPRVARLALPALHDRHGLAAVPALGYWRDAESRKAVTSCRFSPKNSLAPAGFTVAYPPRHIIS